MNIKEQYYFNRGPGRNMYNMCLLLQIDLGNIKQCLFQSLFSFTHNV